MLEQKESHNFPLLYNVKITASWYIKTPSFTEASYRVRLKTTEGYSEE